ncbi:MAG: carbamoyltransferase C-terminal domain-containing protein [Paracoccaceae bacterium]
MRILGMKPGHDGHICSIKDGELEFSIEAEKDSWPRYEVVTPHIVTRAMELIDDVPDAIAMSGWVKGFHSVSQPTDGNYFGIDQNDIVLEDRKMMGRDVKYFASSHERSHIFCSFGMSSFPQGKPFYALTWEGNIGAFYRVDENMNISLIGNVMEDPGNKYAYLYALADAKFPDGKGFFRFEDAGKLMALCSYGSGGEPSAEESFVIDKILDQDSILLSLDKADFKGSRFYNIGVEDPAFKELARKHSDAIFETFHAFAREHLTEGLPLVIGGGCGLNCDWNSAWHATGLFADVFTPPCTNDSGSAIGTAIEAQFALTGSAKINWNVYAGEAFIHDIPEPQEADITELDLDHVVQQLAGGAVIAWARGRYEIGPRALGNRSILANTFSKDIHRRLNDIKKREGFRPIAPICLEEEATRLFEGDGPSPYMLRFQKVRTDAIPAVTHVDGSARLQSVTADQNPAMFDLLTRFKEATGYGVLCNTSLNFNGTGFINRLSDLHTYAMERELDGYVVDGKYYCLKAYHQLNALREAG